MALEPKSYSRTVTANQQRLHIQASATRRDWSFRILHQAFDGKRFTTIARGASARYAEFETAQAAVEAAVVISVKFGWPTKEPSQGLKNLARNIHQVKIYDPKKGR